MAPAQKPITMPSSPFLQVATPPNSPLQGSPLGNADKDDYKQVLVDVIKQVLVDKMSAEAQATPPNQSPLNIARLTRLLETIADPTSRSPKSTTANVAPHNTPFIPHIKSQGDVEALGLMMPSPDDPNAHANHAANIPSLELAGVVDFQPADTQCEVARNNLPTTASAPGTMDQLKKLFQAASEQKSESAAHSASHPSKLVIADIMPANTPQASNMGSVAMGDAGEPIGLMVPPPNDPRVCADWTSTAVNHRLRDGAQTNIILDSASGPVTMGRLRELFIALLGLKSQSPPSVRVPEDAAAQPSVEGPRARFKRVTEIWDKGTARYKIVDSIEPEVDGMDHYVFVAREHIDERSKKSTVYIDVKSEILRDTLREVLRGVKAISLVESKPKIEQTILFHFLPELNAMLKSLASTEDALNSTVPVIPSPNDPDAYTVRTAVNEPRDSLGRGRFEQCNQLGMLVDYISEVYTATVQRLEPLLRGGDITYDLLDMLFKPGCYVYTTCLGTGKPRCVIFDAGEELMARGVTYYKLECHYLDYDGQVFGEVGIELAIIKYRGSKPIHSLEAFPLIYHPDRGQVWRDLVACGCEFRELIRCSSEGAGAPIRYCRGRAFTMKNDKMIAMNIDSRVAVDAAFFHEMQPHYHRPRVSDTWQDHSPIGLISIDADEQQAALESVKSNGKEMESMVDGDFVICCPTVRCFSFNDKLFLECAVGDMRSVAWSQITFDRLQLPEDKRHILLSVISSRLCNNGEIVFDDFIKGKGCGLNVLLYGVPGVGKTFTVEATAEYFQVPLYSVSAGELIADHGDPLQLDMVLDRIFYIAKHFNMIILIDEADVFMENRASYHSNHNRLVTIFLRKLEYYKGILFLTTNRVMEFDGAVLSRIHLKIKYDDLTKDARREILTSFLADAHTKQGPPVVEPKELDRLASMTLNGRDVKSLVSVAQALAAVDKSRVTYQYLKNAAKANDEFADEFSNKDRMDGIYM